jgi:putative PIN family toxin of toxin-antitoxin system
MKVVIDCNVFISAGLNKGTCRNVIERVLEDHTVYFSKQIIEEYLEVATRPRFQKIKEFDAIWQSLRKAGVVIEPARQSFNLADQDDEIYLATALAAKADVLITGDRKHFPFSLYESILILSPSEFLMVDRDKK